MNELQFLVKDKMGQVYEARASFYALNNNEILYRIDGINAISLTNSGFDLGCYLEPWIWQESYLEATRHLKSHLSDMFTRSELKQMEVKR